MPHRTFSPSSAPAPWRSLGDVLAGIPAGDQWGPFSPDITDAERLARLRSLRALALAHCGPHGDVLRVALRAAETEPEALAIALEAINGLPAVPRRHLLASYAVLDREGRGNG